MPKPEIIAIRCHRDGRGSLGVIEMDDVPFPIRRVYYLFDVPIGAVRGEHGHRTLDQLILCMHGRVEITLNDGSGQFHYMLDAPDRGLHVPPGMWRSLRFVEPGSVICVLASQPYDRADYIYHYEEFLEWTRTAGAGLTAD